MNIRKKQLLTYIAILFAGLLLGWLIFGGSQSQDDHADHDQLSELEMDQHVLEEHMDEEGNIVYTCSMHPSIRQDEPGNCPICGMDLIPVSSERQQTDDYSMVMTQASMQLANILTAPVIRKIPQKEIHLPGRVLVDERKISYVTTHFDGRLRDVKVNFEGAPIRKGEVMASIYSPELVSAQRELLEAAAMRERNPQMLESAKRKFKLWEFTDNQIQAIIDRGEVQTNMDIHSPADGFITKRNAVNEQHVIEGTVIYEVANLDHLWVTFDAYEEDLGWLQNGSKIEFTSRSNPGSSYSANVDFIDPTFNPQKRTISVRANVENADHSLRPEMIVSGVIHSEMSEEKLMVPSTAVLWTGPRSLLYVRDTDSDLPRFEVREVELGAKVGDYYVIEKGVEEGEEVVFHGAFRIDSEMQLADKFSMMNREPGTGVIPAGHQHEGMGPDEHALDAEHEPFSDIPDDFRAKLTEAIEAYISGKDALVESDLAGSQNGFGDFIGKLNEIGVHGLSGDGHMAWMESWSALMEHGEGITLADELEEARVYFRYLSDELIAAVQMFGVVGVVYHQYCPMAFEDEGANWLSSEEQIQNPFLPETMLGCGEVIERIE